MLKSVSNLYLESRLLLIAIILLSWVSDLHSEAFDLKYFGGSPVASLQLFGKAKPIF